MEGNMNMLTVLLLFCLLSCSPKDQDIALSESDVFDEPRTEITVPVQQEGETVGIDDSPEAFGRKYTYKLQEDYYEGEDCYGFPLASGWLDVYKDNRKLVSLRAPVDIVTFASTYGFSVESTPPQNELLEMKEVQLLSDGISIWVTKDEARTSATWVSKIEITNSSYIVGGFASVGLAKSEFENSTGITISDSRVILFYEDSTILPAYYGYKISGTDFDMLETFVEIKFLDDRITLITLFVREGFYYP